MTVESQLASRGVRGAITADANTSEEILLQTRRLLAVMIRANEIVPEDVASALIGLLNVWRWIRILRR